MALTPLYLADKSALARFDHPPVGHRLGPHRIPLPDLLIAAVAELNNLAVLHYDADYDRIASVTQQPSEWIAPRGSIP